MDAVLDAAAWRARQAAHHERVDAWITPHLQRAARGESHPVHDFLFTYYSHRPAQLRRWHPGAGVALAGDPPHRDWSGYTVGRDGVGVDVATLTGRRAASLRQLSGLLRATADRAPLFGCFGLHEWAMVYRSAEVRHASWPLRLSPARIAEVVEAAPLRCTHYDAFRFFTADAAPRNLLPLHREAMVDHEQPGCLHTNMDLYKVAYKLTPLLPSELVGDCFALARDIRELDMRAAPYDLRALGYEPVQVETTSGRARYVAAQQAFAARAAELRARLLAAFESWDHEDASWNSPI